MRYLLLVMMIVTASLATNLKELLRSAALHNDLLKANSFSAKSAKSSLDAINKSYYPTIDIALMAQNSNPKTLMRPGTSYVASITLNYLIYDGSLKRYLKEAKRYELSSIKDANRAYKKSLYVQIAQDFYALSTLEALKRALLFKKRAIAKKYEKVLLLQKAGIVNEVALYDLKAALENLKFNLNSLEMQKETLLMQLAIKSGRKVSTITPSSFIKKRVRFSINDTIKSLKAKEAALLAQSKSALAKNNLKLNLSLEHKRFAYDRYDAMHPKGLSEQSTITLSASKRLFDGGVVQKESEAIRLQSLSLRYKIKNAIKEQKMQFELAKLRIKNQKTALKSAKANLLAAKRNYEAVEKKFNSGLLDSTIYLDALSQYAQAKADYKKASNDLELAYALYYFSAGKNIEGYLR